MKTLRASMLKSLLPLGALLAIVPFAGCIDPVIIGGNGSGGSGGNGSGNGGMGGHAQVCSADADCAAGEVCQNGQCTPQGGEACGGQPSPVSCTQGSCPAGYVCTPDNDPNSCHPSNCSCDAATNSWVCTADCQLGGSTCVPGVCTPGVETCNGIDDDCDGVIDESDNPNSPLICADGSICMNGQCGTPCACPPNMTCDQFGMCIPVCDQPGPETCNGVDDDCDGQVDEETPGAVLCPNGGACVNGQCNGGVGIACMADADCPPNFICDPATAQCTPIGGCVPAPELCNGIDDDCDGVIDDAVPGTTLCPNGAICMNGSCGGQIACNANADCPAGMTCVNGICK